ncbi:MAG: DUF4430 domain-containing protein [Candidatus Aureabacteria bacterium]|nr:DUF4430 domain-containing protein [Candidatus Auribacterota bacterium]
MKKMLIWTTILLGIATQGVYAAGEGYVTLRVGRDFRNPPLLEKRVSFSGQSVMKLLQCCATVETAFGGAFVQSINGLRAGKNRGAGRSWFYYVNGLIAGVGAAQYVPENGDCVSWDLHAYEGVGAIPALIGCFPHPFLSPQRSRAAFPLILHDSASREKACALARVLERQGVKGIRVQMISDGPIPDNTPSIIIGRWDEISRSSTVKRVYEHRDACGVFVEFNSEGLRILALDRTPRTCLPRAGAILAARGGRATAVPIWLITGTDHARTSEAADILIHEPGRIKGMVSAAISGGRLYPVPIIDMTE